jgi:hypothetical protein
MIKQFFKKPYVAVVFQDYVFPGNKSDYDVLINRGNVFDTDMSIFTDPTLLIRYLNSELNNFIKDAEGLETVKNITFHLEGEHPELGDGDLDFTLPNVSMNHLAKFVALANFPNSTNKDIAEFFINDANSKDDLEELLEWNIHYFSISYTVAKKFHTNKRLFAVTVRFEEVNPKVI